MSVNKNKIIVIVGTTASGKTTLAVDLACKFNGEVVSADSRQVYKYMDVGTGKDLPDYCLEFSIFNSQFSNNFQFPITKKNGRFLIDIQYHCINLVHPNTEFSLGKWKRKAEKAINEIGEKGRVPIVAGGTGLYSQALVDGYDLSQGKPDRKQRAQLEKMSVEKLYEKLLKLDEKIALGLNNSDKMNKRRLIRKIEILLDSRQQTADSSKKNNEYYSLVLGITWPKEVLMKRILKRINDRLENEDMLGEVERLHVDHKVSWKRLMSFGLEYKYLSYYLQGEISYNDMIFDLARATYQFSRRQMTWLRRWEKQGRAIHWVKNKTEARKAAKQFIK